MSIGSDSPWRTSKEDVTIFDTLTKLSVKWEKAQRLNFRFLNLRKNSTIGSWCVVLWSQKSRHTWRLHEVRQFTWKPTHLGGMGIKQLPGGSSLNLNIDIWGFPTDVWSTGLSNTAFKVSYHLSPVDDSFLSSPGCVGGCFGTRRPLGVWSKQWQLRRLGEIF